jgi:hypothetical protein
MKLPKLPLLLSASVAFSLAHAAAVDFAFVPNFITPPKGMETIGNGHGEIQVDSSGKIYVSVEGQSEGGIQVYSPEGKFLSHLPLPGGIHGFSIRKVADGEFIFAAVLSQQKVIKASLDGKVVLEIPRASFPAEIADGISVTLRSGKTLQGTSPKEEGSKITFTLADGTSTTLDRSEIESKSTVTLKDGTSVSGMRVEKSADSLTLTVDGKPRIITNDQIAKKGAGLAIEDKLSERRTSLKITNADAAPNGDIYVVDGYGSDWIFVFDSNGKFKHKFGGKGEPFKLANCHKVHVDNRYSPPRIFLCDRGNNRILHASLAGEPLGVIATEAPLRRPSSASFHGDYVTLAEIAGRISVWDKEGKLVASLGANDNSKQTNTPGVPPADWRENVVTSPHGVTFDAKGNILETEWNKFGRVLRWDRK